MWWGSTRAFVNGFGSAPLGRARRSRGRSRRRGGTPFPLFVARPRALPLRAACVRLTAGCGPTTPPRTAGLRFARGPAGKRSPCSTGWAAGTSPRPAAGGSPAVEFTSLALEHRAPAPACAPLGLHGHAGRGAHLRRVRHGTSRCPGSAGSARAWGAGSAAAGAPSGPGEVNHDRRGPDLAICASAPAVVAGGRAGPAGLTPMCGIALIHGPAPRTRAAFRQMIGSLAAARRGGGDPADRPGCWPAPSGCASLDAERAVQPFTSADGRWVLCYKRRGLQLTGCSRAELTSLGHRPAHRQ